MGADPRTDATTAVFSVSRKIERLRDLGIALDGDSPKLHGGEPRPS